MQHENPINEEIIDLTATFPQSLKDGEHLVYSSDRINLFAIANGGKITWRATNNHGHKLEVTYGKEGWSDGKKCWVCAKYKDAVKGICVDRIVVPCWTRYL